MAAKPCALACFSANSSSSRPDALPLVVRVDCDVVGKEMAGVGIEDQEAGESIGSRGQNPHLVVTDPPGVAVVHRSRAEAQAGYVDLTYTMYKLLEQLRASEGSLEQIGRRDA